MLYKHVAISDINVLIINFSKEFQTFILDNEISFEKLSSDTNVYNRFTKQIQSIQNILYAKKNIKSIAHIYSCSDENVNKNVQGSSTERQYIRITLANTQNLCAILFIPKDNMLAQTPPHSHCDRVKSISITGPKAIEISFNCSIDLSGDTPNIILKSIETQDESTVQFSDDLEDHIVCFTSKETLTKIFKTKEKSTLSPRNFNHIKQFINEAYKNPPPFNLSSI